MPPLPILPISAGPILLTDWHRLGKRNAPSHGQWPQMAHTRLFQQLKSWLSFLPPPITEKRDRGSSSSDSARKLVYALWLFVDRQTDESVSANNTFHFAGMCKTGMESGRTRCANASCVCVPLHPQTPLLRSHCTRLLLFVNLCLQKRLITIFCLLILEPVLEKSRGR